MTILVTGAAGFIGAAVAHRLLDRGEQVLSIDCLNDYYEVSLKEARLAGLNARAGFTDLRFDLANLAPLEQAFRQHRPTRVVHLAAQAGVRYSLDNPHAYIQSNVVATTNILECCRHFEVAHLVYASSSSVYGANTTMPFAEQHNVDHPLSLYAATKKANELMAHTYSHLYGLPTTGLRFFTVYGPWGRPDMAAIQFTRRILAGEPINVYNHGKHKRDFTYIDDITAGLVGALDLVATGNLDWDGAAPDPSTSTAPFRVYNIGNDRPVALMDFIHTLESALGRKAELNLLPMQPGDVPETRADISALRAAVGYNPVTPIEVGIPSFVRWYRDYHQV